MATRPDPRHLFRSLSVLAAGASVVAIGGCYTRVVGVKNDPGYTGTVYEQNVDEGNEDLFRVKKVTPKGSTYVD